jgi:hypothetical protein
MLSTVFGPVFRFTSDIGRGEGGGGEDDVLDSILRL